MNEAEYAMRNYADLVRVLFTLAEKIGRRAIDPSSSDNCHPTKRIVRYKNVSYYCAKYCLLLTCLHTHCGPICIAGLHWNLRGQPGMRGVPFVWHGGIRQRPVFKNLQRLQHYSSRQAYT